MKIIKTPTGVVEVDDAAVVLSQAEYDALPESKKKDGTYYIYDGGSDEGDAGVIANKAYNMIGTTDISYIEDGTLTSAVAMLNKNKVNPQDVKTMQQEIQSLKNIASDMGDLKIIGDTDISGISDGTLTGSVSYLNNTKADKTELSTLQEGISANKAALNDKAGLDSLEPLNQQIQQNASDISNLNTTKANVSDLSPLNNKIEANTTNINTLFSTKAESSTIKDLDKKITNNSNSVQNLANTKADQTQVDALSKDVEKLKNQSDTDENGTLKIIGNTDISNISDGTLTGAVYQLNNDKASNKNLDTVRALAESKASQTSVTALSSEVSTNKTNIDTLNKSVSSLDENKANKSDLDDAISSINSANAAIIGDTDITGISDGTLTGAVSELNAAKADKATINSLQSQITSLDNSVTSLNSTKADKTDLDTANAAIDLKANQSDVVSLETRLASVENATKDTATNSDIENLKTQISANSSLISGLEESKAEKSDLDNTNANVDLKADKSELNSAVADLEAKIQTCNNEIIGATDISKISDGTITGAIAEFNVSKANKVDLDSTQGIVLKNSSDILDIKNDVSVNTQNIDSLNETVGNLASVVSSKVDAEQLQTVGAQVNKNTEAISDLNNEMETKADSSVVNEINDNVNKNTGSISTLTTKVDGLENKIISDLNSTIIGIEDISAVSDTLTGAVNVLQSNKADKTELDTVKEKVSTNAENISTNTEDISTIKTALDSKANSELVNEISKAVQENSTAISSNTQAIATKASQEDLDTLKEKVEDNITQSSDIQAALDKKADKTTVEELDKRVTTNTTDIANKADLDAFNTLSETVGSNTNSISSLLDTMDTKADKSDVQKVSSDLSTVSAQVTQNTSDIASINSALDTKLDKDDFTDTNAQVAANTKAIAANAAAIKTKASQKDLDKTNETVAELNASLETAKGDISTINETLATKANQSDLDDTNAAIASTNAVVEDLHDLILTKANQTDLDATNAAVKVNKTNIKANSDAIATKADQSALDETNGSISALTQTVSTKADQSSLDKVSEKVSANTEAIATKAEQSDLNKVSAKADANEASLKTKASQESLNTANSLIAANATAISKKADQSALDNAISNISANTDAIATKANQSELDKTNEKVTSIDGRVTAVETELENKVDKDDLDVYAGDLSKLVEKVEQNTTDIATKANQTDLDETNKNVSANTKVIATKADQTALDDTNTALGTLTTKVNDNTDTIATKADQTALDSTNKAIAANTTAIETKADKEHTHVVADITDFPTSMPASDVYSWAKQPKKPTYTAAEVGADASGAADTALSNAKSYTDTSITNLVNGAPETMDTLKELADAISENDSVLDAVNNAITTKADKTALAETDKKVAANTEAIATKASQSDLNTTNIAVSDLSDKVTANETAIATKANQADLDKTNKNLSTVSGKVNDNAAAIATKANQTDLDATNKSLSTLSSTVSSNTNAIATKADQSALDKTNKAVATNTSTIATKADKTALEETNSNLSTLSDSVSANTAAIATKANQTDLDNANNAISDLNDAVSANSDAIETKADKSALEMTNENVSKNASAILENKTAIATKADQSALEETNTNLSNISKQVQSNSDAIATKAEQSDLDSAVSSIAINSAAITANATAISKKADQSALAKTNTNLNDLSKTVATNSSNIATKANQTDLDETNKNVSANATAISNVDTKLDEAIKQLSGTTSDILGNTDITGIGDGTVTGAVAHLEEAKAEQTDLDATIKAVTANTAAIETKADKKHTHVVADITDFPDSMPASDVYEWAKQPKKPTYTAAEVGAEPTGSVNTALTAAKSYTDTSISNLINGAPETMDTLKELADAISENDSVLDAVNSAIGTKADKSALAETNKKVTANTEAIATKADQSALDETNIAVSDLSDKVTANETAIKTKADKTELNKTNSNLGTLSEKVTANETAIATKASQADLDSTNSSLQTVSEQVATNTDSIATKASQTDLNKTNTSLAALTKTVSANTTAIGTKANQSDLDDTNANVSKNAQSIVDTNKAIETLKSDNESLLGTADISTIGDGTVTGAISNLQTDKANQADLDKTNKAVSANTTAIAGKADKEHDHVVADITDFPTSMPASDVYEWAKQPTKPTYTATEVGADPTGSANTALTNAKSYTDTSISNLINGAPETMDTLKELADAISENDSVLDAVNSAIGTKADKTALEETNANVAANTDAIKTKANQTDLDKTNKNIVTIAVAVATKANQSDLNATNSTISTLQDTVADNTEAIATKADSSTVETLQSDVSAIDTRVSTNTANIATKANQSALDETNKTVKANSDNIDSLNSKIEDAINNVVNNMGDVLGSTDISTIGDGTVTGAISHLETTKAEQSDLNNTNASLTSLSKTVDGKADKEHTHVVADITDFPTSMPASDVYEWAKQPKKPTYSAAEVGADVSGSATSALTTAKKYTDTSIANLVNGAPETMDTLKELADAISENDSVLDAVNSAIGTKADKTALEETNKNVTANTNAIKTKANQADLDATNATVSDLSDKVTANADALDTKLDKTELTTINNSINAVDTKAEANAANIITLQTADEEIKSNVAKNAEAILGKADVTEVAEMSSDLHDLSSAVSKNTTDIATKANQTDLDKTSTIVSSLCDHISDNDLLIDGLQKNYKNLNSKIGSTDISSIASTITGAISSLNDNKAEQTDLDATNKTVAANKTAIAGKADKVHTHVKADITDFPSSMPASDVYSWAKQPKKPTYTAAEVGADASGSANTALTTAKSYTDTSIANLINGAPETMDTLKELADAISENDSVLDAVNSAIGTKADKTALAETDKKVAANTSAIATKAEQSDLEETNTNLSTLSGKVSANETAIAKKANKSDLDATNSTLSTVSDTANTNKVNIATNAANIESNTKKIDNMSSELITDSVQTGDLLVTGTIVADNGITGDLDGNASTATKLATARKINGVAFDGTSDITITDSTKASKSDFNTLSGKVSANTTAIASKANQTDLDTTNANVSTNASDIQAINTRIDGIVNDNLGDAIAIIGNTDISTISDGTLTGAVSHLEADKANASDLTNTNKAVSANTTAIAGKADKKHTHVKADITDFPNSMPASDVYSWAKQPKKPTYTASEVGADASGSASSALSSAKSYTDTSIANLVNGAPETMDTLKELADAISNNGDILESVNAAIGNKADKTALAETDKKVAANETAIATKAAQSDLDNAVNRITAVESKATANATAISKKANQSDLTSVTNRVTAVESKATANASAIATKANQTDLDDTNARVTTVESKATANAKDITALKSGLSGVEVGVANYRNIEGFSTDFICESTSKEDISNYYFKTTINNIKADSYANVLTYNDKNCIVKPGKNYIVSYEVSASAPCRIAVDLNNSALDNSTSGNDNRSSESAHPATIDSNNTNKWIQVWYTYTASSSVTSDMYDHSTLRVYAISGTTYPLVIKIRRPIFTRGTILPDWVLSDGTIYSKLYSQSIALDNLNTVASDTKDLATQNASDIATKANQSDLDNTNKAVSANTTAISGKADKKHTHVKADITDFPSSMPASDVYSWAKQPKKPTYTASEVGADASGSASSALSSAKSYTDTSIANLVNGAPETMDTLKELADAISENDSVLDAVNSAIGTKADKTALAETDKKVAANTSAIATKADQTDLDATNTALGTLTTKVNDNTDAIATKASQTDLDATNSSLSDLSDTVSSNTSAIATKADKTALSETNKYVAANINAIKTKANQTDLDKTNKTLSSLTNTVGDNILAIDGLQKNYKNLNSEIGDTDISSIASTITGAISALETDKANQSDLDETNKKVAANTTAISGKADTSHTHVKADITDFPSSMPASDVYEWAKQPKKPTYTASEVGADASGSANTALNNAKSYTDTSIANLVNGAPETMDTLKELADAISDNDDVLDTLNQAIAKKADKTALAETDKKVAANTTAISSKASQTDLNNLSVKVNGVKDQSDANKKSIEDMSTQFSSDYIEAGSALVNGSLLVQGDIVGNVVGNASTATKLATARKINGVAFDGTKDITITDDTKASKSDLNTLSSKVTTNANAIATKASQTSLNETNKNVTANADAITALGTKVSLMQGDTNSSIGTSDISEIGDGTITGAISHLDTSKAEQSALDSTNKAVSANTTAIAGKANASHTHVKADITDFPTSMPASDVYPWAKQSKKPTYTAAEVGADASGSANTALTTAKSYTDTSIANLVNGAPETMDTLKELADAISDNGDVLDTVNQAIAKKADKTALAETDKKVAANTSAIATKANQSDLTNAVNRITAVESKATNNATEIAKKANSSDLTAATNRITAVEGKATTNANDIKSLKSGLAGVEVGVANYRMIGGYDEGYEPDNDEQTDDNISDYHFTCNINSITGSCTTILNYINTDCLVERGEKYVVSYEVSASSPCKIGINVRNPAFDDDPKYDDNAIVDSKYDVTITSVNTNTWIKVWALYTSRTNIIGDMMYDKSNLIVYPTSNTKYPITVKVRKPLFSRGNILPDWTLDDNTLFSGINNLYTKYNKIISGMGAISDTVDKNTSDIATKANQSDLDATNKAVSANTTAIAGKANKTHKHVKADITDFPTSMPASDVYSWAKQSKKPTYTASEVGADASGAANTALANAKSYTDTSIANLVNGAPETMDTLKELADAIADNDDILDTVNQAIANKADKSALAETDKKVAANTSAIATKAEQSDLDAVNGKAITNATNIGTINDKINAMESEILTDSIQAGNIIATGTIVAGNGISGDLDGNADTATKLATARKINGVTFDGTKDITITDDTKASKSDLSSLSSTVSSNTAAIATKANQSDLDKTNKTLSSLSNTVDDNMLAIDLAEKHYKNLNSKIGDTDISSIGSTVTEAISSLNDSKADNTTVSSLSDVVSGKADKKHTHVKADITDFPSSMPASDVYSWAKQPKKPTYTASEVGADASGAANTALTNAKSYTDTSIANLVNGAPETMDTLKELADAISDNGDILTSVNAAIGNKADKSALAETDKKVAANTTAISGKADQSDLDSAVNRITAVESKATANATAITKKANTSDLTAATNRITAVEGKATTNASNITSLTTTVNNIGVGVRNYRRATDFGSYTCDANGIYTVTVTSSSSSKYVFSSSSKNLTLVPGENYIVGYEVCVSSACTVEIDLNQLPLDGSGGTNDRRDNEIHHRAIFTADEVGTWKLLWSKYTFRKSETLACYDCSSLHLVSATETTFPLTIKVKNPILVRGTILPDWTMAQEDIKSVLNTSSSDISSLQTRVSAVEAKASTNATNIATKANQSDLANTNKAVSANTTAIAGKADKSHTHTKADITDFPSSMPASDVYSWAKQSKKPTYTAAEVGADASGAASSALSSAKSYTDTSIANLVNGAPETMDTLKELADAISDNGDVLDSVNAAIAKKADKTALAETDKNVAANTSAIATKAEQSDLDTTNSSLTTLSGKVTANSTAISGKADQSDLDTTNKNVSSNSSAISTINSTLSGYATQISTGKLIATSAKITTLEASTITGSLSGNAATATKLATARKINGVAFDGTKDITITDDTKASKTDLSALTTRVTTNEGNIAKKANQSDLTAATTKLSTVESTANTNKVNIATNATNIADAVSRIDAMSTEIDTDYIEVGDLLVNGSMNATNGVIGSLYGNADTATKLATARKINGVAFDGTKDITITDDTKASKSDLSALTTRVTTNESNIAKKANQSSLDTTNDNVSANTTAISNLSSTVNSLSEVVTGGNLAILGSTDISNISDGTLTGAVSHLEADKANASDLTNTNKAVSANTTAISGKADKSHKHVKADITDFPSSMPASDVYSWAKASKKPTYTAAEVGADASGAANTALASAKSYTDTSIANLVNGAPETMDTLKELADAISSNGDILTSVNAAIGNKADKTALADTNDRVTALETTTSSHTTSISNINSSLSSLGTRVGNVETKATNNASSISSLTTRVTTNESNIAKKANSSDLTSLSTKVSDIESKANTNTAGVSANKTSIANLTTTINDMATEFSSDYIEAGSALVNGSLLVQGDIVGNVVGNASTADRLSTAATIGITGAVTGSATFDGQSINITTSVNHNHDTSYLKLSGGTVSGNLKVSGTITGSLSGNASTATKLATARKINGVAFDGTSDITIASASSSDTANSIQSGGLLDNDMAISDSSRYVNKLSYAQMASSVNTAANNWNQSVGLITAGWDTNNAAQIAISVYKNTIMKIRGAEGAVWGDWITVLTSSNYAEYTVKKDGTGASGSWGISVTGNAATATKLATARTISLTGSVTGSASFDGSGNISIATTTAHNHDSSYVKLSGSTMTGTLNVKNANALNVIIDNNTDKKIWCVTSSASASQYGFYDMYKGTGDGNDNTLVLYANNQTGTDVAVRTIKQDGTVTVHTATTFDNTITGNISGSAGKLATARTISLTGAITGSVTFDGSSNVSLATTLASHNHTSLSSVTSIDFATDSSDMASIKTVIDSTATYFDFFLGDDYNEDIWRWRFYRTGDEYSAMELIPTESGKAELHVASDIYVGTNKVYHTGNLPAFSASTHNHDSVYLKLAGGTLTGALNLANNTWNKAGDDALFGDANLAGAFCIKGVNSTTKLALVPQSGSTVQTLTTDGSGNLTISGTTKVTKLVVGDGVTLEYDSTNECLNFNFA